MTSKRRPQLMLCLVLLTILLTFPSPSTPQPTIDYSKIMMHKPEVDLIVAFLNSNDTYLEFGSGGSTLTFSKFVKKAYSMEHNCDFASKMKETLDQEGISNVKLICSQVKRGTKGWGTLHGFEHGNYKQFRAYVDKLDDVVQSESTAVGKPLLLDKVLIDGRARMACGLKVLPYLKDSSVVFLHDFYGDRVELYGPLLKYYHEIARVLAYPNQDPSMGPVNEPQGLLVMQRKPGLQLPLSADQIMLEYESINFRGHDPVLPTTTWGWFVFTLKGKVDIRNWKLVRNAKSMLYIVQNDTRRIFVLSICLGMLRLAFIKVKPIVSEFRSKKKI